MNSRFLLKGIILKMACKDKIVFLGTHVTEGLCYQVIIRSVMYNIKENGQIRVKNEVNNPLLDNE